MPLSVSQCCIWITFPFPHRGTTDLGYSRALAPPFCFSLFQVNKQCLSRLHCKTQEQQGQNRVILDRNNWVIGKILGISYLSIWILHLYLRINISRIISSFLPVSKKCGAFICGWVTHNHQGFTQRSCEVSCCVIVCANLRDTQRLLYKMWEDQEHCTLCISQIELTLSQHILRHRRWELTTPTRT